MNDVPTDADASPDPVSSIAAPHLEALCDALLLLRKREELLYFLKDLCTPSELHALAERWHVCRLLDQGGLSYRDIHRMTSASLTTIGRVARFLKNEPYRGYRTLLERIKRE